MLLIVEADTYQDNFFLSIIQKLNPQHEMQNMFKKMRAKHQITSVIELHTSYLALISNHRKQC